MATRRLDARAASRAWRHAPRLRPPSRSRVALALLLFLCGSGAQLHAQDRERPRDPPVAPAIVGGSVGSLAGGVGGALLIWTVADCEGRIGSDEEVCDALAAASGVIIGSTLGATWGAMIGARLGGATPSFGRTLLASTAGMLVGAGAALVVSSINDGAAVIFAYNIGQGTLAGLSAALWQRKDE